jgi:hypothetical protein
LPEGEAEIRAAERTCLALGAALRKRERRRRVSIWGQGAQDLAEEIRAMIHLRAHGFDGQPPERLRWFVIGNVLGTRGVAAGLVGWSLHGLVLTVIGVFDAITPAALTGLRIPKAKHLAGWWMAWGGRPREAGYCEADTVFALNACIAALYGDEVVSIVALGRRLQDQRVRDDCLRAEFHRIGASVSLRAALESVVSALSTELREYAVSPRNAGPARRNR